MLQDLHNLVFPLVFTFRDGRMDSWRDFQTKKKSKSVGETKAPKMKEEDDEHTFIQRPIQRDFRRVDDVKMKEDQ